MNSCNFVGRLIKDGELRYTGTGVAVFSFTIAVDNPFAQGEHKSDLVNIVAWKKTAENCANYLSKGKMCSIESRYSPRNYDNNEGKKVYIHEFTASNVRFLGGGNNNPEKPDSSDPFADDGKPIDISSDDLPF